MAYSDYPSEGASTLAQWNLVAHEGTFQEKNDKLAATVYNEIKGSTAQHAMKLDDIQMHYSLLHGISWYIGKRGDV